MKNRGGREENYEETEEETRDRGGYRGTVDGYGNPSTQYSLGYGTQIIYALIGSVKLCRGGRSVAVS